MIVDTLTWWDIVGCLRGVVAFAAVLLAPGYCLAWAADFLGFRERPVGERLAWAIALSFGVGTIAMVELGKYGSLNAACWFCGLCSIGFGAIVTAELLRLPGGDWSRRGAAIAAAWIVLVVLSLVDFGVGNHLYLSVTIYDHSLRTTFVDSVMRTGVPPVNPLYLPGHQVPMRYYYFWYVLTAIAAKLGAISARQALIASSVWSGFGMAAMLTLYGRHFLLRASEVARRRPRLVVAIALLAVTGLDLVPALVKAIVRMPTDADPDWWAPDQVGSWLDAFLWVPHHIAGLLCCLFGFLLAWIARGRSGPQRALCAGLAGLSFASAFGLSTWVALGFALVMVLWMPWALWREPESRSRVPVLLGAVLVAALALMPYVTELRNAAAGSTVAGNAEGLLQFGVRHMIDPDALPRISWLAELTRTHPRTEDALIGLILLLPGYFFEFGFFGFVLLAAIWAARRSQLDEATRTALALTTASLLVSTLLRSSVIDTNDFGFRSILIAQFFLLLLAVLWCEGSLRPVNRVMHALTVALLWIGVAGTAYQAGVLRLYLPVEEKLGRPDEIGLSERAMAWRTGFDAMDRSIPKDAVVQFNTDQPSDYFTYAQIVASGRQIATAVQGCAAAFGGDPAACPGMEDEVTRLFTLGQASSAAAARVECSRLGAGFLVATRWDRGWFDRDGWVWTLPVAVETEDVRVLDCEIR